MTLAPPGIEPARQPRPHGPDGRELVKFEMDETTTASQETRSGVRQDDAVRVRGESWRVDAIETHPDCEALTLVGRGRDNRDVERTLLYPFDRPRRLSRPWKPKHVAPRRWTRRLARLSAGAERWESLWCAASAHITLHPYQLEPALAAIQGRASRFLLADEVGLGKTIQAALLIRELALRGLAARTLLLTPPGLVDQWRHELDERFTMVATIMTAETQRQRQASLPPGANPWSLPGIYLASLDFAKRLEIRRTLEQVAWDVVRVDEAHWASSSSDRGLAVSALSERARYVVLVTATPHSGDGAAFEWLTRLGRLGDVTGGDPIAVFRRSRRDIGLGGRPPARTLRIRPTPHEHRMHSVLAGYTRSVWTWEHRATSPAAILAMVVLNKRALSSPGALHRSVVRRLAWLGSEPSGTTEGELPLFDDNDTDEQPGRILGAPGLADTASERVWLASIRDAARVATRHESKLRCLHRLLRRTLEPVVIFTEYRDTLEDLAAALKVEHALVVLHGALSNPERRAAERRFDRGNARILLATDVAGEGLNLQARCRWVVNYELPWNPMRLEQRVGRVDRLGQSRRVHAVHLVADGTAEANVLARLAARLDRAGAAGLDVDHILGRLSRDRLVEAALTNDPAKLDPFLRPGRPSAPRSVGRPERRSGPRTRLRPLGADASVHREAARLEAERLTLLRGLSGRRRADRSTGSPGGTASLAGPGGPNRCWLTMLPRTGPSGLVVVCLVHVTDDNGQPVATLPMAWLVETILPPHLLALGRPALARASLEGLTPLLTVRARRLATLGKAIDRDVHAAFVTRALTRETTLLERLRRPARSPVQAGLFDRRALRQVASERRLLASLIRDSERRLDRLERARSLPPSVECQIALVGTTPGPPGGRTGRS